MLFTVTRAMAMIAAGPEDVPALVDLVETCYRREDSRKGWTTEVDLIGGTRATPATVKEDMEKPNSVFWKYVENGEIIGCVYTQKQADKMFTAMLCVRPDLQAAGLGKKEDLAREMDLDYVSIIVVSRRTELVQWYERKGFKHTGKLIPFPVRDGFGDPKVPVQLTEMLKNIKEAE